jgi:hypothetical protein
MDPMPGFAHGARDRRKRHLLGEHQHQRLEQQREPGELADPVGLDERHLSVRQPNSRNPNLEATLMLEEVQVAQLLDVRVVNWVFPGHLWMGKAGASWKINVNRGLRRN